MKILTKTLSAIAFVTLTAGAALAGPSNPSSSFGGTVPVRQTSGCPMIKAETKLVNAPNVKTNGLTQKISGYRHEGCTGATPAKMTCGSNGASCASMRQS